MGLREEWIQIRAGVENVVADLTHLTVVTVGSMADRNVGGMRTDVSLDGDVDTLMARGTPAEVRALHGDALGAAIRLAEARLRAIGRIVAALLP